MCCVSLKLKSGQPQCDVEVCADGFPQFPFPAHRSLLSARCRFFRDALAAAEPPAAGSLHRITIPNTTPAMLHAVLGFVYRDKLVLPEVTTLESVTDEGNGSVVAVGWEFVFDYSRRLHSTFIFALKLLIFWHLSTPVCRCSDG
jgi:BTB/POZ domain